MDSNKGQKPVKARSRWRARTTLIGFFMLFFGPILAALWLNIYAPQWQPFGYINRGELVVPVVRVQATALNALDGRPLGADYLTDRWTLVYAAAGGCNAVCENSLLRMRRVREVLGKDRERVQRLFIQADNSVQAGVGAAKLLEQFPGLRITSARAGSAFDALGREAAGTVVLIDPQSFLMMRFPAMLPINDMLKDLQRLLKLSKRD